MGFRGRLTMTGLCESICCLVFNFARNLGVTKVLFEWISCGFGGMGVIGLVCGRLIGSCKSNKKRINKRNIPTLYRLYMMI